MPRQYRFRFEHQLCVPSHWEEVDELDIPSDILAQIQNEIFGAGSYSHPHFDTSSGSVWRWELIPATEIEEVN